MCFHTKQSKHNAAPGSPNPVCAMQMQEILGGHWSEISLRMGYLFQGWNCRGPAKYRDMLMDISTEEADQAAMIAIMIARLLETSPVEAGEAVTGGD